VSNNNDLDPAASTQMFRAFVEGGTPNTPTPTGHATKSGSGNTAKLIGVIVAVVVAAAIAFAVLH